MSEPSASGRAYRIGIDVGGTFTKAVLIDNATHEVVGRFSVLTTHADPRGVAKGVVEVFRNVLEQSGVDPEDVVFLAHSTTQATNALLEGDVASVGVIGMSTRVESLLAKSQSAMKPIELAPGRYLKPANRFLIKETLTDETIGKAIEELKAEGAKVIVASSAFGVDDNDAEEAVRRLVVDAGLAATCGHEITKLYGLTTRTRTAVINASILPKMIDTATMTEASVREAGIQAPLMIMRGDGGVMDIRGDAPAPGHDHAVRPGRKRRRRADVSARVRRHLLRGRRHQHQYRRDPQRPADRQICARRRPRDLRQLARRARDRHRRRQHGPRPQRQARRCRPAQRPHRRPSLRGLCQSPKISSIPQSSSSSRRPTIPTTTSRCARPTARAMPSPTPAPPTSSAMPSPACTPTAISKSARRAIAPLADFIGKSVEDAARAILDIATDKVIPVVDDLIAEYELDRDQAVLVGEGGGAAALIPHASSRTGLHHEISQDAEVISSIGVALALVREVVERVIPNPQPEDLKRIRREAFEAVVKLGAAPDNVEVTIEVDPNTHRVRATAMGASEMRARQRRDEVGETEAREIAAKAMGVSLERVALAAATPRMRVFQGEVEERSWGIFKKRRSPVRAVDLDGVIRVQRSHSVVRPVSAQTALDGLRRLWEDTTIYNGDSTITPDIFVIIGGQLIDLSGVNSIDQAMAVTRSELDGLTADASIALIGIPPSRGL